MTPTTAWVPLAAAEAQKADAEEADVHMLVDTPTYASMVNEIVSNAAQREPVPFFSNESEY